METLKFRLMILRNRAIERKKPLLIIAGVIFFLIIVASFILAARVEETVERVEETKVEEKVVVKPETVASPLSGQQVSKKLAKRPVTAVVYNNYTAARPQTGLRKAGVVHETIAEADITRFVAFFQEGKPEVIGPVRSQRPYFNDWALQYDAAIAHVGGSVTGLAQIQTLGVKDMDQFVHGNSFWRASDRLAPHNVYTSTERLDALSKSKGYTSSTFTPIERKKEDPAKTPTATKINVNISSYAYNGVYKYNKATNSYNRSVAGKPDLDRENGKQISPKVVVVLKTNMGRNQTNGRYQVPTTGGGGVYVFQDGKVRKGRWNRKNLKSQIAFTDNKGNKIRLNPGQAWFTYIDSSKTVTYE